MSIWCGLSSRKSFLGRLVHVIDLVRMNPLQLSSRRVQHYAALCCAIFITAASLSITMGNISHVCVICSQHFTRKHSADRHIENIHSGAGNTLPILEYLVARAAGLCKPQNPREFRRPQKNFPFTKPPLNADGSVPQNASTAHNAIPHMPNFAHSAPHPPNPSHMAALRRSKIDELRILATKRFGTMQANLMICLATGLQGQVGDRVLDQQLENLRKIDEYGM
jgi:hypothetical protein